MTMPVEKFLRAYAVLTVTGLVLVGVIAAVGYVPTTILASHESVVAMCVGCGVSWIAGCVGAIPVAWAVSGRSTQTASAILGSTGLRFVTVLVLVVPLVLSGWWDRTVLVLWVVISYLLMLMVDTWLAIRMMKRATENDS